MKHFAWVFAVLLLVGCASPSQTQPISSSTVQIPVAIPNESASGGQSTGDNKPVTNDQQKSQIPDLADTTVLVTGAGQTETVTTTDSTVIRQLVEALNTPLAEQLHTTGSLYYVNFMDGNQTLGQLWVLAESSSRTPKAIRFDGDTTWHTIPPEVAQVLQPILQQVPGMKMP